MGAVAQKAVWLDRNGLAKARPPNSDDRIIRMVLFFTLDTIE